MVFNGFPMVFLWLSMVLDRLQWFPMVFIRIVFCCPMYPMEFNVFSYDFQCFGALEFQKLDFPPRTFNVLQPLNFRNLWFFKDFDILEPVSLELFFGVR